MERSTVRERHLVVETILDGRADAERAPEPPLAGLAKHVGAGVPEDLLALLVIEGQELELAAGLERAVEVPELLRVVVEARDDGALVQAVRDALRDLAGGGLPRNAPSGKSVSICPPFGSLVRAVGGGLLPDVAIGHRDRDGIAGLLGDLLVVLLLEPIETTRRVTSASPVP